jgi:hypothetical protein
MIPAGPLPTNCPFWDRSVTLGRVHDTSVSFTTSIMRKRQELNNIDEYATYFVAWTGKYSTDLFTFTKADALRLLGEKK